MTDVHRLLALIERLEVEGKLEQESSERLRAHVQNYQNARTRRDSASENEALSGFVKVLIRKSSIIGREDS